MLKLKLPLYLKVSYAYWPKVTFIYASRHCSIMRYKNLVIVGTSHVSSQSVKKIERTIDKESPGIIAVELDKKRLHSLLNQDEKEGKFSFALLRSVGLKGFMFALLGSWLQKKIGKMVGVDPGSDMLVAVNIAKEKKIKLALIDQDIEITLRRFSKSLTWKERWRFVADIFKSIFSRKKQMKKYGLEKMDLTKVPPQSLINKMVKELKKRYPNIYKVLIEERNNIMTYNLIRLMHLYPEKTIVAVIGAGHERDMIKLVKSAFNDEDKITYEFSVN